VHKLDFVLYKPLNISGISFNATKPTQDGSYVGVYPARIEQHPHQVKLLK
jgi:hypothetical protein